MAAADVTQSNVNDVASAATAVPVDPRATADDTILDIGGTVGQPEPPAGELRVELEGYPVTIRASVASTRDVVATAYLIGGFGLVLALVRRVTRRVEFESQSYEQLDAGLRATKTLPASRISPQRRAGVLADTQRQLDETAIRLRTAREIRRLLVAAWDRIATAEEEVLREYEPHLIAQFVELASQAEQIAFDEWVRYGVHDSRDDADADGRRPTLTFDEAQQRGVEYLRIQNETDTFYAAIRKLYDAWLDYLHALDSSRRLAALGPQRIRGANPTADPYAMLAASRRRAGEAFASFDRCRSEVGDEFPAALQVYGQIPTTGTGNVTTSDTQLQEWAISALLDAIGSARKFKTEAPKNAVFAKPGARLRVDGRSDKEAVEGLPGYQRDILDEGLTVPATRAVANRFTAADETARSPWFQLPVRNALYRRGTEGDPFLQPYTTPGRLHHAALSELNTALEEVRRVETETTDRALLIMDAIAAPLAFFTGGSSLAIAGVVHAIVRAREMYVDVETYEARDELARIALIPMQQAIWGHPSAVKLAGKLLEGGFEIATDLVTEGAAGAVIDAIQISLTLSYGTKAVAAWVDSINQTGVRR